MNDNQARMFSVALLSLTQAATDIRRRIKLEAAPECEARDQALDEMASLEDQLATFDEALELAAQARNGFLAEQSLALGDMDVSIVCLSDEGGVP